ncbi:MAG: hypothetical protein Q9209_001483 [Squamulea sp. 1 TL-2023]
MDLPSLMKSLYPTKVNHKDTSGLADTTSSESFGSLMRNFHFPDPPKHDILRIQPLERRGVGQLPRNNSWATESTPDCKALQNVLNAKSIEAYVDAPAELNKSTLTTGNKEARSAPENNPIFEPTERHPTTSHKVTPHEEHTKPEQSKIYADRPVTAEEDIWVDVTTNDGGVLKSHSNGSSDKENNPYLDFSFTPNDAAEDASITKPFHRRASTVDAPEGRSTIFVDAKDRKHHPQPLAAHPNKTLLPSRRPLAPTSVNTSRLSPTVRAPWYRQKARTGSGDNHRSSIYGPGALARKVQQEVMITVNVELDVLRREMNERFAYQKTEFEFEIKKSQVWALQVDDENRKLREELAKERKRREEGRAGGRVNLC